ncbi:hypothetical protein FEM48_Zijuj09G0187900 [Ziziphus jujuba var. spinosa]|uniref:Uncharacterized protein n=1 Tax=Ziziphus jujuba var. spinosa TaxID=714518 RepID=A0A978UUP4_ZIZJJ|nr:hypothetical protein FEM48_Zijuj09G0187900 [Ziziphus jujuba var. spinosa]
MGTPLQEDCLWFLYSRRHRRWLLHWRRGRLGFQLPQGCLQLSFWCAPCRRLPSLLYERAPYCRQLRCIFGRAYGCRTMIRARRKEDLRNSIIGGAAAGGVIKMHRGLRASARWTLYGGAIVTLIEGAMIMAHKVGAKQNQNKF